MDRTERNTVAVIAAFFSAFCLVVAVIAAAKAGSGNASSTKAGGGTTVAVTLKEFSISPAMIQARPGDITLTVTNTGTMEHNLGIRELGKATRNIQPGETVTLTLSNVKAGNYTTFCSVPGHENSGMTGMLMVSDSASGESDTPSASDGSQPVMDWQQMDALMLKVAKEFLVPNNTKGHGGDPLVPKVLADGTKEFDLEAKIVDWEVSPGKIVKAWTYNGVVPAPEIRVNVGDKVKVVLANHLPESTSLHFHGIRVPNNMDGVDPYTQDPIPPGSTFTYSFTAPESAVGIYHSHHDAQIQVPNGMFGAFTVGEMPIPASLGHPNVVKTINMVLNDAGTIGLSLNGKSFPGTEPYTFKLGDSFVVNYLNEGLLTHPMHLHQPIGWIIAKDGHPLVVPVPSDTITVAPGERYTVLYTATDKGVWAWHCHILNHAETPQGMTGMVTAIIVQ